MRNKRESESRSETLYTKQNTKAGNENITLDLTKSKHQNVDNIKGKLKTNTENRKLFHHSFSEWNAEPKIEIAKTNTELPAN